MRDRHTAPLYPLFVDLDGRRVLVVGAGPIAERRVSALQDSRARVTVVAPDVGDPIADLAHAGLIDLHRREFRDDDVAGHVLVFSATGDVAADSAVSAAGRAAGVLVNVADELGLSDFHVPAVGRRGDVQVAVSTGGSAPGLAARIRDRIAEVVGPEWGALASLLGDVRRLARKTILDRRERMAVMKRLAYDDRLFEELSRGVAPSPESVLEEALAASDAPRDRGESSAGVGSAWSAPSDTTRSFVSIVGAGPGDPELITVVGLHRLREADVVVYDDLVDERLLAEAPTGAELIYGGKRGWLPNDHRPGPELLVAKALEGRGKRVVRLKGGDPSVFGRLAEELEALEAADVPHEVIPGVTAALAAAASARIPLTRRGCAQSITLSTAVREGSITTGAAESIVLLREGGTLALYMGLRSLREFAEGLVAAGIDHDLPVVVVAGASTPAERVVETTLACAATAAQAAKLESPALVLMGCGIRARTTGRRSRQAVAAHGR